VTKRRFALRETIAGEVPGVSLMGEDEDITAPEAPEYETPPPWSPGSTEAISICFAMGVPRTALLVTPHASNSEAHKGVEGIRCGRTATRHALVCCGEDHILNGEGTETTPDSEGPVLLVSTLANVRGLDFPDLSHVFVMEYQRVGSIRTPILLGGQVGSVRLENRHCRREDQGRS